MILLQGGVTHIMQAIFNAPMVPNEAAQRPGLCRQTTHIIVLLLVGKALPLSPARDAHQRANARPRLPRACRRQGPDLHQPRRTPLAGALVLPPVRLCRLMLGPVADCR